MQVRTLGGLVWFVAIGTFDSDEELPTSQQKSQDWIKPRCRMQFSLKDVEVQIRLGARRDSDSWKRVGGAANVTNTC